MINIILGIVMSFTLGCVMGTLYFAGLWWTVQRLPRSRFPGLLTLVSFCLRAGMMILGILVVGKGGHWERMLVALLGVIVIRFVLVQKIRPRQEAEGV